MKKRDMRCSGGASPRRVRRATYRGCDATMVGLSMSSDPYRIVRTILLLW